MLVDSSELSNTVATLPEVFYRHVMEADSRHRTAFWMVDDQGAEEGRASWHELHEEANRLAALIRKRTAAQDRVMLMYPQGLDFVVAFLACMYAEVIAVPVNPPRKSQTAMRLLNILDDAQCSLVLSTEKIREAGIAKREELRHFESRWCLPTEASGLKPWLDGSPRPDPDSIALLQYTSGSTGSPKGVMVSHANLLHNSELIRQSFALTPDSCIATWLPMFHDMGLIGNMLQTFYAGSSCVLMAPSAFIRNPVLWLRIITRYRATHAGAPNFGFEHTCRRVAARDLEGLDLSSWKVAFCGAEPIRKRTLEQFAERFRGVGFSASAFLPTYGMAEATLAVTAAPHGRGPRYDRFGDVDEPGDREKDLISCGPPGLDTDVRVVDPVRLEECPVGHVGELWVRGPGVARGYWNCSEQTQDTFGAQLAGGDGGQFLRTGDLGYLKDGELYVAGRRSDLIIIRGRNHYPQDIELAVQASHSAFAPEGVAAFSVEEDDEERLVVLIELERTAVRMSDKGQLLQCVQQVLGQDLGLTAHAVVLLKPGKLLKTSSGKVQRRACKAAFMAGSLDGVAECWPQVRAMPQGPRVAAPAVPPSTEAIALRMRAWLAQRLNCDEATLDMSQPLSNFGMDSVVATEIALGIEQMFGVRMAPTALFDYPDIRSLASYIARPPAPLATAVSEPVRASGNLQAGEDGIAIVGMAGQFPGAPDIDTFWKHLLEGRDGVREVPPQRWKLDQFFDPDPSTVDRSYSKWGGLLDDIDAFDPQFFNISPREAELMDPQQRLFLQQAWRALEHAGFPDHVMAGRACSLFVGCSDGDYRNLIERANMSASAYTLIGNAASILASRLSYFLNLRGLCTTVDTACSSSLVAVHLACENLRSGQSDIALAGGVCVLSTPQFHVLASKASMLSPKGRCRTFDRDADGFVPAEAVGVVVLKRLAQAQRDGDTIHAVIRASGANQDGRTNGITAPSGLAQTALETEVYRRGSIDPRRIGYVEAHGTGTVLGDPIEVGALAAAFREFTPDRGYCAIGSVKTNIGHALAAAGVAGLIKAVLSVREGKLPASLHAVAVNPHIDFEGSPFYPLDRTHDWPLPADGPRMAAISSFGFSGTNAHVVIESPPAAPRPTPVVGAQLLVLSAKTVPALREVAIGLRHWLQTVGAAWSLHDVASTLALRRSHFPQRWALAACSVEDAQRQLGLWLEASREDRGTAPETAALEAAYRALDAGAAPARLQALQLLAAQYVSGGSVEWARVLPAPGAHAPLPHYPFARERYWVPVQSAAVAPPRAGAEVAHAASAQALPAAASAVDTGRSRQPRSFELASVPELRQRLERDLVAAVAGVLKLEPARVNLTSDIRDFGFDSINMTELTQSLNERYGTSVTPPQLFEHRSLASLATFLLEDYAAELAAHYRPSENLSPTPALASSASLAAAPPPAMPVQHSAARVATSAEASAREEPIAIIGIAGTLPGAENLGVFWRRLIAGDDLISEVPAQRWDWRRHFGSALEEPGQTRVKWGGFMPDMDRFDAAFFGISRHEANLMDPQQRLFLQTAWHAIEDAGYAPRQLSGTRTGVFAGIFTADYNELLIESGYIKEAHAITGLAHSVLPNRVSYLLDLHGPSVPVDTACSSSLVALHQAVESIRSGSSDMALVGGVNVMVSQTPFMSASRAGMICDDGRCKTFDKRANGYARGEGVGVVLIKPLRKALADRDHVYALIKGTAVNHGGAANSLTSPNPEAQADVIRTAMQRAGLSPTRLSYIEAHGTGTGLGDPIEINGLKKAYRELYEAAGMGVSPGRCGIGTVKTQIGHLEAAAGIAGLLKVVLSLQHRRLHGNIHLQEQNPYIALEDSPFYLVTDTQDWPAECDAEGDALPRCAGISSFGFGGANAHVVLEEWPAAPSRSVNEPQLILLSARTLKQLEQLARQLNEHLRQSSTSLPLDGIAFTLQCGRNHEPCRWALQCSDVQQLQDELEGYLQGRPCSSLTSAGPAAPAGDEELSEALRRRDLTILAQAWLSGRDVDWAASWQASPRRVPLPGYPFAAERHWIPAKPLCAQAAAEAAPPPIDRVHPLVGRVELGSPQTIALTLLHAQGYYFIDHQVAAQPVLPAAAMLEIMRAAAERALGRSVPSLTQLSWLAPLTPTDLDSLRLVLSPVAASPEQVTLVLESVDAQGRVRTHCEGVADGPSQLSGEARLDLVELARSCTVVHDVQAVYAGLRLSGLAYGPAFQALHELRGGAGQSWAKVQLSADMHAELGICALPPSLLDAAFQAVAGMQELAAPGKTPGLLVPFRIKQIEIRHALPAQCIVHARLRGEPSARRGWTFDIDVADAQGQVLVRVHELNLRLMQVMRSPPRVPSPLATAPVTTAPVATAPAAFAPAPVAHCWTTVWQPTPALGTNLFSRARGRCVLLADDAQAARELRRLAPGLSVVLVVPHSGFARFADDHYGVCPDAAVDYERLLEELDPAGLPTYLVHRWSPPRKPAAASDLAWPDGLLSVFHLLKALISHPARLKSRLVVAATHRDAVVPAHAAIAGLLKSVMREHPKFMARMLSFCAEPIDDARLLAELLDDSDGAQEVRHLEGARLVRQIQAWQPDQVSMERGLVSNGVYWITGGLGGIGQILARHLARQHRARIVLSGRRASNAETEACLAEITRLGGQALYVTADVGDAQAARRVVERAEQHFGPIQGVFHSAGVLRDGFMRNKTVADMHAVLVPKVLGLRHVEQACAEQPLDFIATFSSVTGVIGNVGQGDYAAANAYMDAYIAARNQRGGRGRGVALDWPLWAEGGMQVTEAVRKMLAGVTGMDLLDSATALQTLESVLRGSAEQVIVAVGQREKIHHFLGARSTGEGEPLAAPQDAAPRQDVLPPARVAALAPVPASAEVSVPVPASGAGAPVDHVRLRRSTETFLIGTFAAAVGLSPDEVEANTPFQNLGVDSFIVLQLLTRLEQGFGPLPKTLLFENHCVADLADYFMVHHLDALQRKLGVAQVAGPAPEPGPTPSRIEPLPATEARGPLLLLESRLGEAAPEVAAAVATLVQQYGAESSALGRANFAPYIFLGAAREGLFYCNRKDSLFVAFGYLGQRSHLAALLAEMERYCEKEQLELHVIEDEELLASRGQAYWATPFAVLQRVSDLQSFSIEGSAMRRLRYQVARFEKEGQVSTREYTMGQDRATEAAIVTLIARWCEQKVMVNPYIERVVSEIRQGRLAARHRLFLTHLNGVLLNVIIISEMPSHDGWLMDCEFYPPEMPLGGLEYAIIAILEQLKREGRRMFSMGVTWGAQIRDQGEADPQSRQVLAELAERRVFDGAGNLQFKNKFRPQNTQIYLYKPRHLVRDRVLEIILLIANSKSEPSASVPPVIASSPPSRNRAALLEAAGFNPANLEASDVEFDLATDSWAKLQRSWVVQPTSAMPGHEVEGLLRTVFPFAHVVLVDSGNSAERCLWQTFRASGKRLLQNLMFPTFIYNEVTAGYQALEIARAEAPGVGSLIDLDRLRGELAGGSGSIGGVCIELLTNAAGGQLISLAHVREIKALLAPHGVPLVLDATRVLDNAVAAVPDEADPRVWDEVREICALADVLTASLSKNFGVIRGGVVATNQHSLSHRVREYAVDHQLTLAAVDQAALGAALSDPGQLLARIRRRARHVGRLADALRSAGLPLHEPVGRHAVLVDAARMSLFADHPHPLAALLHHVYERSGVRGGLHSSGAKRHLVLGSMLRFALPVGMPEPEFEAMLQALRALAAWPAEITKFELVSKPKTFAGDVHARFRLVKDTEPSPASYVRQATLLPPAPALPSRDSGGLSTGRQQTPVGDIAIIGVAGRYPQADTLDQFWRNLSEGRDSIEQRPLARWSEVLPTGHELIPRLRWGGFINDVDKFDSMFFGISPKEVALLDPQERLFMEIAWATLEDAGYTPESLVEHDPARKVGVFVGAVWQLYQMLGAEQTQRGNLQTPNSLMWSIANRVSAFMNFTGPSLTVDTACSGSLASIYLACQAIRNGECQSALAGGVNLDLHASKWLLTQAGGFLSPDGRCKAFGKGANGYVAGEGLGAVLLKPLSIALADGDNIHAVIKACTFNHGGRASGYAVPNPNAQADLVATAIAAAGVDARTISYIETHGTGTHLGDPIEIQGLTAAMRRHTNAGGFCAIGSVKTNIGHLEAAAGIAGLTKVLLQMRHRTLVPSLHCEEPNELINFEGSPFYVQTQSAPWEPVVLDGVPSPLRAGVSSFGAGGANLHLIVEEPPAADAARERVVQSPRLIVLSAHTEDRLAACAAELVSYLDEHPSVNLDDLAYTLQCGRQSMSQRLGVVADDVLALREALIAFGAGKVRQAGVYAGNVRDGKAVGKLLEPEDIGRLVAEWTESGRLDKLALAWTQGVLSDLRGLAARHVARRISLPTYPFAKVSHWIRHSDSAPLAPAVVGLHPLLDRNESDFDGVRFCKSINTSEYLYTDHIVAGVATLPGVAYIEMACAAHHQALGAVPVKIRNLVWAAPINSMTPGDIRVQLKRGDDAVTCEITTRTNRGDTLVHAQAKLRSAPHTSNPPVLDLSALRARLGRHKTKAQCYELLSKLQFRYGECFQAIDAVDHDDSEALTRLVLPNRLRADLGRYHLHPSLMDGATQSVISVVQNERAEHGELKPYVPFVAGEIDVYHPLTPVCYAHVRLRRGARDVDSIKKVDLSVTDESGRVLVEMSDYAFKAFSLDELAAGMGGAVAPRDPPFVAKPGAREERTEERTEEAMYFCSGWE